MNREMMISRFRELAVKHALEEATDAEISKMERYQALLRRESREEKLAEERQCWRIRKLMKELGAAMWKAGMKS